jgi:vacuolar-type H+-ATPase subunit C/Vma6
MISGRIAYGNARVRALKSQLFDIDMFRQLRRDEAGPGRGTTLAGQALRDARFRHLLRCYAVLIRSYPTGLTLFRALVRLHEIENLKLVWRAHVRKHRFEHWRPFWRPLDVLEAVRIENCRDRSSLSEVVDSLRGTPYSGIAHSILRAHANDLAAAELAFDRWASEAIAAAAAGLGGTEATARDLALSVVRERDLNLLRRGVRAYGLSADAVLGSLVVLPGELPAGELAQLATWNGETGRIIQAWPKVWHARADLPANWDALLLTLRRTRREACRRAFLGPPFCLAPPVALLLLQEEEVRGIESIQESAGRSDDDDLLERVLAASALRA